MIVLLAHVAGFAAINAFVFVMQKRADAERNRYHAVCIANSKARQQARGY